MNQEAVAETAIGQFRQQAGTARHLGELRDLFTRAMRRYGAETYAVGLIEGPGAVAMHLNTWPRRYVELYASNALINEDPIVLESRVVDVPFTWTELSRRRDLATSRVMISARAAGLFEGFAIPIPIPEGGRGLVALGSKRLRMTDRDKPTVVKLAHLCFAASSRLYARQHHGLKLAPRERDALALVAQGCDDAAIGTALGITRTSAHVYVERAKRRLGATTRAHAVAIATAEGLL